MDASIGENLMPCDPIDCDSFTLCTADILEIFYFNHYSTDGPRPGWEDSPERMVDGLMYDEVLGDYSAAWTTTDDEIQWCDENTSPIDRTTTITKVEIRAFSGVADICGTCTDYLRPIFASTYGDTHSWLPPGDVAEGVPLSWSPWLDITNDTNAPPIWTWADVNTLDVDHWSHRTVCGNLNICHTARIEIRVTWHDCVVLSGPMWNSLDNKLDKSLKKFNLWRDYKLADVGIEGQPLNFEGIEVGVCEAVGEAYGTCFPLCMPFCFDTIIGAGSYMSAAQVAQEKMAKIHSWMENNYNVVLNEFEECFDAEFAIKNFVVQSMNHPSNYRWKLSLEKA